MFCKRSYEKDVQSLMKWVFLQVKSSTLTEHQNKLAGHVNRLQPSTTNKRRDCTTSELCYNQQSSQLKPTKAADASSCFVGTLSKTHATDSLPVAERLPVCDADFDVQPPSHLVAKKEECVAVQIRPLISNTVEELPLVIPTNDDKQLSTSDHVATSVKHGVCQPVLHSKVQGDLLSLLGFSGQWMSFWTENIMELFVRCTLVLHYQWVIFRKGNDRNFLLLIYIKKLLCSAIIHYFWNLYSILSNNEFVSRLVIRDI
jgi:hypothetical protein